MTTKCSRGFQHNTDFDAKMCDARKASAAIAATPNEAPVILEEIFNWLISGANDRQCCRKMAELLADAGYPIWPSNWPVEEYEAPRGWGSVASKPGR